MRFQAVKTALLHRIIPRFIHNCGQGLAWGRPRFGRRAGGL